MRRSTLYVQVIIAMLLAAPLAGQIVIPEANGNDGILDIADGTNNCLPCTQTDGMDDSCTGVMTCTIDLGLAVDGAWDVADGMGNGVYDSEQWAVVFQYQSVNIPGGKTLRFQNHPTGAPVVWVVTGDVTIAGTVNLVGQSFNGTQFSEPGPGGFRGGAGRAGSFTPGSSGFGPGGGSYTEGQNGSGGMYAGTGSPAGPALGQPYGYERIIPLIGGSGGSVTGVLGGGAAGCGAGAGGGAILIATQNIFNLTFTGEITTQAGFAVNCGNAISGSGSGGAIRIIANQVMGAGTLTADSGLTTGNEGSHGRIRVEANSDGSTITSNPGYTFGSPIPVVIFDPAVPTLVPTLLTLVDGDDIEFLPDFDPQSRFDYPNADKNFETQMPVTLTIEATGINDSWSVSILVTPRVGPRQCYSASSSDGGTTWISDPFSLVSGISAIQVRADETLDACNP